MLGAESNKHEETSNSLDSTAVGAIEAASMAKKCHVLDWKRKYVRSGPARSIRYQLYFLTVYEWDSGQ
jgi:hypothetical protein